MDQILTKQTLMDAMIRKATPLEQVIAIVLVLLFAVGIVYYVQQSLINKKTRRRYKK